MLRKLVNLSPLRKFWRTCQLVVATGFGMFLMALMLYAHPSEFRHPELQKMARQGLSRADAAAIKCLARNVYWEARSEPQAGMYFVAYVTDNRKRDSRWPSGVCAVVYEKYYNKKTKRTSAAFSWTLTSAHDKDPSDQRNYLLAVDIALDVWRYGVPVGWRHYFYYLNPDLVPESTIARWEARDLYPDIKIGSHLAFVGDVPPSAPTVPAMKPRRNRAANIEIANAIQ